MPVAEVDTRVTGARVLTSRRKPPRGCGRLAGSDAVEIETDLKVTSDRLLRTIEQLDALESEKRTLKPDSDRFQYLAKEVERLAATIFAQSQTQQRLGRRAQATMEQTGVEVAAIDDSEATRELSVILAEWRDAERRMSHAAPDSAEYVVACADADRLRNEYQRTYVADAEADTRKG